MLGELPPEPVSLLGRQMNNIGRAPPLETPGTLLASEIARPPVPVPTSPAPFDVDVSNSQKLYLIVQDSLSTAPDKAGPALDRCRTDWPGWHDAALRAQAAGSDRDCVKTVPPLRIAGGAENGTALRVKLSSVLVYDIAGKGYTRFRGATGFEAFPLVQGEIVQARFFVFDQQPDMDRLVPPNPETPLPPGPALRTVSEAVDRVYWYALGRAPSVAERRAGGGRLAQSARTCASLPPTDLRICYGRVIMTPEFQLIR